MKTRQDAWTEANDMLLAETVLRHIREGSTQLNAFEEVGDKLNRTSAACGFRWNAVVRDEYDKEIQTAKKQRKQRQRALNLKTKPLYTPPPPSIEMDDIDVMSEMAEESFVKPKRTEQTINLTMEDVIHFLEHMETDDEGVQHLKLENDRLKKEMKEIATENEKLEKEMEKAEKNYEMVQNDYQSLVQIMDRARKMVLFSEEDQQSHSFKMDRNGNLERIAK